MDKFPKLSDEQVRSIINYYRKHECLYNRNSSLYKDTYRKESLLKKLAMEIEVPVTEIRRRYANLRQTYLSELRKHKASEGGLFLSTWRFYKDLHFLESTVKSDKQSSSVLETLQDNQNSNHSSTKQLQTEFSDCLDVKIEEESDDDSCIMEQEKYIIHEVEDTSPCHTPDRRSSNSSSATAGSSTGHLNHRYAPATSTNSSNNQILKRKPESVSEEARDVKVFKIEGCPPDDTIEYHFSKHVLKCLSALNNEKKIEAITKIQMILHEVQQSSIE